jgi:phospholipid/cholesterol/gamma-HCH transport system substrate-binding protein
MLREIGRWRALANASFALIALALGSFGFYQVAGRQWRVQPTFHVRARFETISGLEAGHRVRIQGMDAGVVEKIIPPHEPGALSSSFCVSTSACEGWFAPTPWRGLSPKD